VEVVAAAAPGEGLAEVRARLDRIYRQPAASTSGGRCAGCQGGAMRWPHRHHLYPAAAGWRRCETSWSCSDAPALFRFTASIHPHFICSPAAPPREVDAERLAEAVRIRDLLALNSEELRSVARALNGEYILPEAGGDLLRDGAGAGLPLSNAGEEGPLSEGGGGPPGTEHSTCGGRGAAPTHHPAAPSDDGRRP
jgi:hypothetical protein